jgi:hypothetical protein
LRNEAQLEQLVQLQGNRQSPLYHRFIGVPQAPLAGDPQTLSNP